MGMAGHREKRQGQLRHRQGTNLGDGEAVLEVDVLALNVTVDDVGLRVAVAGDLEGDVGRGEGLDLEGSAVDGVVLEEEVRRRLAEVLESMSEYDSGV
jgi:hypothetical protein